MHAMYEFVTIRSGKERFKHDQLTTHGYLNKVQLVANQFGGTGVSGRYRNIL